MRHETTRRFLVLRLDANDDRVWDAEPIIPPFNYSIEHKNVRGTFVANLHYPTQVRVDSQTFFFKNVTVYGVLDLRYLIPLSDPFKVKNSISIRQLLDISRTKDLYSSPLWEMFIATMMSEAYLVNQNGFHEDAWDQKWKYLTGGAILTRAMQNYLEGGGLAGAEKKAIISRISASDSMGYELAENLLIRLFDCVLRDFISLETAKATIRCQHFRSNLSSHEIVQFLTCCGILDRIAGNDALKLATEILKCLQFQPYSRSHEPEFFEYAFPAGPDEDIQAFIENHGVDNFNLFLQEDAGEQPFLTLTVGEDS